MQPMLNGSAQQTPSSMKISNQSYRLHKATHTAMHVITCSTTVSASGVARSSLMALPVGLSTKWLQSTCIPTLYVWLNTRGSSSLMAVTGNGGCAPALYAKWRYSRTLPLSNLQIAKWHDTVQSQIDRQTAEGAKLCTLPTTQQPRAASDMAQLCIPSELLVPMTHSSCSMPCKRHDVAGDGIQFAGAPGLW
jgi:hypothetical protein